MHNTTNVNHALFTKRNETRFVEAFERLVDHITKPPVDQATKEWLESTQRQTSSKYSRIVEMTKDEATIAQLKKQLAEANAKLSNRF